jgi:mono/diheme cytochrome c family protein
MGLRRFAAGGTSPVMPRIVLALIAACAACSGDATGGSASGPDLYARLCAACHGANGKPQAAMELRLGVRDLTAPEMRARITPVLVEQQVRRGSDNKLMPSFEGLVDDAQIKALSAYVASPAFLSPR